MNLTDEAATVRLDEHRTRVMELVVLGASGGCGRHLVTQSVARGHAVTAVTRASSTLNVPDGVRALRGSLSVEAPRFEARTSLLTVTGAA